jgi:hypothetical protein
VLTPGGYRHPALVHRISPGHALDAARADRLALTDLASNARVELPELMVRPGDVPGFGTGWIAYASWTNNTGSPITALRTTWRVPNAPSTQSGQTIFLFNGIDPVNPSAAILQPVLQWGVSAAGGGPYWSVASWYVTNTGQAFHTTLIPVNAGDTLVGEMTLTGQAGGKFSYASAFQGMAGTNLPVQNVDELVWCNQTLEAYAITQCSDYPASPMTAFSQIAVQTSAGAPTVNWTPDERVTDCGQHVVVVSNSATAGEVDIFYRRQAERFPFEQMASAVRILIGVTNDGGGIVILPNGQVIHIPPRGPSGPLLRQLGDALTEVGRGLVISEIGGGSSLPAGAAAAGKGGLDLVTKGLEAALVAVRDKRV